MSHWASEILNHLLQTIQPLQKTPQLEVMYAFS